MKIDASCRLPVLALLNGAALWLVLGLAMSLLASLTFHNPEKFACCRFFTYGHVVAAANDLLVYGFAIPAALAVILWIFARLSQAEVVLPLVPFLGAHLYHAGVLVGTVGILTGHSTGYAFLEYPRAAAALIGAAFVLISISAVATFGQRQQRELYPAHWFLFGALLWFPAIYSSANLFLGSMHPVRGVAQAVIDWWFVNNFLYVWFALVGLGIVFYFVPKMSGRPLHSRFYVLFAFLTLMLFGTWLGIPAGAPVPAWLPAASRFAALLLVVPIVTLVVIFVNLFCGAKVPCFGGNFCYLKYGSVMFLLSSIMVALQACPEFAGKVEYTWFGVAQTQLQILGFLTPILLAGIYEILPLAMGTPLPIKGLAKVQFFGTVIGALVVVISLAIAGWKQGAAGYDPAAAKFGLQLSTAGLTLLLLGSLGLLLNLLLMTFKWKIGLAKTVFKAVTAPLTNPEVKS
ncbi:MAG TPA: cbb3-type cytochrome c oxidase subunit I [Verrucomicrobiae bacterium]